MRHLNRIIQAVLVAGSGLWLLASAAPEQTAQDPEVLFQRAVQLETIQGNLNAAIDLYKQVIKSSGNNRAVAAKSLLRLGGCYEKLGNQEARQTYQRLVNDYPEQQEEVAAARQRLSELPDIDARAGKPGFRKIQIPVKLSWQSPTPNGSVTAFGARLSPDCRSLAFSSEGSVWVIPVPGKVSSNIAGEPRRLTEAIYARGAGISWSADGNWISFNAAREDGGEDIYVVPFHGGEPKKFASRPPMGLASHAYDSSLSLSLDGSILAFASRDGEGRESLRVQTVARGATSPKSLTNTRSAEPTFSPDGRRIAYVDLGRREIRVIPAGGGESVLVANTSKYAIRSPEWSPDGKMVAYLTGADSNDADELWIVPVSEAGAGIASPTSFKLPQKARMPIAGWTSDNKIGLILGSPTTPSHQALYTVPASGGKATQVTTSGSFYMPRWSPDGESIWFLIGDARFTLGSVPSGGGSLSTIPTGANPAVQEVPPGGGNIISPDGEDVVFAGIAENVKNVNLWMMPLDGRQPTQLTAAPSGGQDRFPCWSHDGKSLLFIRAQD